MPKGRKPGVPNKLNARYRERAAITGIMPLDYMLQIMRDTKAPTARRDDMAKAAAPYLHSRMPIAITGSMTHQGVVKHEHRMIHEVKDITPQEAAKLYEETLSDKQYPKLIAAK